MATSIPLYTQHLEAAGRIRAAIAGVKGILDRAQTRSDLIALHHIYGNLLEVEYPASLVGRIETLSESIQALEKTLSDVEDGIRGTLLYPDQIGNQVVAPVIVTATEHITQAPTPVPPQVVPAPVAPTQVVSPMVVPSVVPATPTTVVPTTPIVTPTGSIATVL